MKKKIISVLPLIFMSLSIFAQPTLNETASFKPNGKPVVTVFSDFTSTSTNGNTNNAIELSRAYFGYGYNFSPNFNAKVIFDIANTAGLSPSSFTAILKNALVEYNQGNVKAQFGLIGTTQFNVQESNWGKRYLYKSFQDQYGFASSADLGASVKLQFIPQLSLDLSVFNGEGYKKVQVDSLFQFAAGITLSPIKNYTARVYYDYMANQAYATSKVAQSSFNVFVGYKSEKGTLGAEYNSQVGNRNVKSNDWSGFSVYGTLPFAKQFTSIARFDDLMSSKVGATTTGWNTATDGQVYMAGIEYAPIKGIQITPNFRYSSLISGTTATSVNVNVGMSF